MLVSLIVAMDRHGLIGTETGLPWHLPRDLKRFRQLTLGKPVIMGRRTHELIGHPLPDRLNIVLTHAPAYMAPGCQVAHSLAEALTLATAYVSRLSAERPDEVMVMGGSQVYQEALPHSDRLYLTLVEGQFQGTIHFPLDELGLVSWRLVQEERCPADSKNPHPHTFYILERDRQNSANQTIAALLASRHNVQLGDVP
jgi:dihydrofolate reductase